MAPKAAMPGVVLAHVDVTVRRHAHLWDLPLLKPQYWDMNGKVARACPTRPSRAPEVNSVKGGARRVKRVGRTGTDGKFPGFRRERPPQIAPLVTHRRQLLVGTTHRLAGAAALLGSEAAVRVPFDHLGELIRAQGTPRVSALPQGVNVGGRFFRRQEFPPRGETIPENVLSVARVLNTLNPGTSRLSPSPVPDTLLPRPRSFTRWSTTACAAVVVKASR